MARIIEQEYVPRHPVAELELHPRNPRRGSVGAIEALIEANGFHGALLVQRSTGFVLVGNHRLQAARDAGLSELPVFLVDADDDEALRILLGDNRAGDLGTYDDEILAPLLAELLATDRSLAGTGYTPSDIADLLAGLGGAEPPAGNTDADDAPPKPGEGEVMSEVGDVYILGRHRLVVGDARDPNVVERALNGRLADAVLTDPPYGVEYEGKTADKLTIVNDGGDPEALELLLRGTLGNCRTWSRPGAAWYVTGPGSPPGGPVFVQVLLSLGVWRQTLVWVKDRFVMGRQDYHHRHELIYAGEAPDLGDGVTERLEPDMIFTGWKPGASHRRVADRRQDSVWEIPRPAASKVHPTMKPVELFERAIRNSTAPGELVLDVYAGSGTTLIACHRAGRQAALVELDPGYADVICRRWQQHTGVVPRLEATGDPVDFVAVI